MRGSKVKLFPFKKSASPLHLVPKPSGGWRPCGDYRRLKAATLPDRYSLPHIQDFAARLDGAKFF